MKSIVQEGSTISKAVESAWQAAGKPKEFTVKVLETPEHNFIGMTTRSAKVALFFKQAISRPDRSSRFDRSSSRPTRQKRQPRETRAPRRDTEGPRRKAQPQSDQERPRNQERPREERPREERPREERPREERPKRQEEFDGVFWSPDMLVMADNWLKGSLSAMDLASATYKTDVNRLYLKIAFDKPLREDVGTERQIFRSFAALLMQHMRNRLKRPLKGFKVVLSRSEG